MFHSEASNKMRVQKQLQIIHITQHAIEIISQRDKMKNQYCTNNSLSATDDLALSWLC